MNKTNIIEKKTIYFEGINALRFFAALAVIVTHVELTKNNFSISNSWQSSKVIFNLGGLGVYFFFVLSGFLITYLLLAEKEESGTVAIKKFYIRRILRIWPLYFLIVIIGFFILPSFEIIQIPYLKESFKENYLVNLLLFFVMLPNLAFSIFPAVPHIGHLWSIGVEEQFYLVWPWLIKKAKNLLKVLILLTTFLVALKAATLLLIPYFGSESWFIILKKLIAMSKFESMAIGGIGAYLLFINHSSIKLLEIPFIWFLSLILTLLIILFIPEKFQDGQHVLISVLFLMLIINIIKSRAIIIKNQFFDFLGTISYGIYMYHFIIIPIILNCLCKFINPNSNLILFNLLLYSLTLILTIAISWFSYFYFEKWFIKRKNAFAIIYSGKH